MTQCLFIKLGISDYINNSHIQNYVEIIIVLLVMIKVLSTSFIHRWLHLHSSYWIIRHFAYKNKSIRKFPERPEYVQLLLIEFKTQNIDFSLSNHLTVLCFWKLLLMSHCHYMITLNICKKAIEHILYKTTNNQSSNYNKHC